eukprot:6114875-Prymnesium_polylepis.1
MVVLLATLTLEASGCVLRPPMLQALRPRAVISMQLPSLVVLDLDMCVWRPEMYELAAMPGETVTGDLNGRGQGVIGVMSGRDRIALHTGALIALQ